MIEEERGSTRISQPPPPAEVVDRHGATVASPHPPRIAASERVQKGDVIDGKYRVDELIGQGGMGQVLGAYHLELEQKVALKFMSPAIMEIPGAVARFQREARAAAKLRSKHICRVLDIGETAEGAKYIVIEHLEGMDLAALLQCCEKLPMTEAIEYVVQACEALGEAHQLHIVHRDIKPSNLFLDRTREGESILKVLDFGISKNLGGDSEMVVTATNALMGSPIYMSPEQLLAPKTVDTRADIWSLGIVLHELVTGRPPFQAETLPEVIALIVNERRPPSTLIDEKIPARLREIIARCLHRDPVRRYRTTEILAEELRSLPAESLRPAAAGTTELVERAEPRALWRPGAIALGLVALAAGIAWAATRSTAPSDAPPSRASPAVEGPASPSEAVPAPLPRAGAVAEPGEAAAEPDRAVAPEAADPDAGAELRAETPARRPRRGSKGRKRADARPEGARERKPPEVEDLMDPLGDVAGDDAVMDPEI